MHHYAARWIVGAFKTTPGDAATTLAGLAPLPAIVDALVDKAHLRWKNLPSQHGVSMLLAQPRMAFLDTHLIPTTLKMTRHGWLPIAPTPRKTRGDLITSHCMANTSPEYPSWFLGVFSQFTKIEAF